jgi:hypothetical protein
LVSSGQSDIFIAKYDTAGNYIWARKIGGTGIDVGYDITLDTLGNIYVTGIFQGTADFNPGSGTNNLTASGTSDAFIVRLNSSGNYQFAVKIGGNGSAVFGQSIHIDESQNIIQSGYFSGTADFNPGSGTINLTSAGNTDFYVVKLSSSSAYQWSVRVGGTGYDYASGITTDANNNVYITGSFEGTVDFNPGASINNLISSGQTDAFVLKLNSSGLYQNAFKMGSTGTDWGLGITKGADNSIYCTGYFSGTVDFNPGTGVNNLSSFAGRDVFLLKIDVSTNYLWAIKWGGWANDLANSLAVDINNNIWCVGTFEDISYMNPVINSSDSLISNGLGDNFISKFNQCPIPQPPLIVNACDSFYWSVTNQTFFASGIYTDTLISSTNCDSILILNLTINHNLTSTQNITACNSYQWNGTTYTSSGTYFDTIPNAAGCDSLITFNLTINTVSDLSTSIFGNTITANNSLASYQWLDCNNNFTVISGATSSNFTPIVNGNYAVELTENGCIDTTACVMVTIVGVFDNEYNNQLKIYPNPTTSKLNIVFGYDEKDVIVIVRNALGQEIERRNYAFPKQIEFTIDFQPGIYLVEIIYNMERKVFKIIKE